MGFIFIQRHASWHYLGSSVHVASIGAEIGFHNALETLRSKYLKVPDEDGVWDPLSMWNVVKSSDCIQGWRLLSFSHNFRTVVWHWLRIGLWCNAFFLPLVACWSHSPENGMLYVVPWLHSVLTSTAMKMEVGSLHMRSLLLIQGSMVGHSFSPFYKYIESLNRELDTIHQVRLIVSYLHLYLANHGVPVIHVLQTWRYTLLCTILLQAYVFLIHLLTCLLTCILDRDAFRRVRCIVRYSCSHRVYLWLRSKGCGTSTSKE